MSKGLRFNKGKLRYDLVPVRPLEHLTEVYTKGAHKYTLYKNKEGTEVMGADIPLSDVGGFEIVSSGADNWRLGLGWTGAMASIERHIAAWKKGEDVDEELGTLHLANAAWGLFSLMEFYKTHPELDDRKHSYLEDKKIGLDIDEVICDWVGPWCDRFGLDRPQSWWFQRDIMNHFKEMSETGELQDFYSKLPVLTQPKDIPFEPHCYVTSRPVSSEVTMKWLDDNGFPTKPVITVAPGESKVAALKAAGVDIFVDDRYQNFVELNRAGICTYLFDAPHNRRYNVGYRRIKTLKELI